MKMYCILLAVLFLSATVTRILGLAVGDDPFLILKTLADIVLFGVCLTACYGLAFQRHIFTPAFWYWPGRLTLALGGGHILLTLSTINEASSPFWPIDLGMGAIIYGLFAIPAIIYANELKSDAPFSTRR